MLTAIKRLLFCSLCVSSLVIGGQTVWAQPPDRMAESATGEPGAQLMTVAELKQAVGGPATITLHLKDAMPQAAFDALATEAKKAGIEVHLYSAGQEFPVKQPITLDLEAQPFWQALLTLSPKMGLFVYPYNARTGITLAPWNNANTAGLNQAVWPCLLIAHEITRTQTFTQPLGGVSKPLVLEHHNMGLSLSAYIDPKLHLFSRRSTFHIESIVDDKGHSLLEDKDVSINNYNGMYSPFFELHVPLAQPAGIGKRIAHLKATLRLVVVSKQESWEVPGIQQAKDTAKTVDDKTYTVLGVEKRGEAYIVRLQVTSVVQMIDTPMGFEVFNAVRLLDDQGHEYMRSNMGSRGAERGITTEISFTRPPHETERLLAAGRVKPADKDQAGLGEPVKLVWEFPTQLRTVEIPISYNDLPLP